MVALSNGGSGSSMQCQKFSLVWVLEDFYTLKKEAIAETVKGQHNTFSNCESKHGCSGHWLV